MKRRRNAPKLSESRQIASYIVRIIGKDQPLGRTEIDSLLVLCGVRDQAVWDQQIGRFESDINPIPFLLDRAALLREVGVVLFETNDAIPPMIQLSENMLKTWLSPKECFSVRVHSYDRSIESKSKHDLEVDLGRQIQHATGATVSLEQPDTRITVYLEKDSTIIARTRQSLLRKQLAEREPGKKQFFHPSMMNSQLARVMCNLAGIMPGDVVLDPFCGGGGILCEITSLDAVGVGIDLSWPLLIGARTNLVEIGDIGSNLIQGDTRKSPFRDGPFDAIVTDPPYGRASSTRGAQAVKLTESLIEQAPRLLCEHGRLCICSSSEMQVQDLIQSHNLSLLGDFSVRVHSGLTRNIVVASI